jgi:hypothetical protein
VTYQGLYDRFPNKPQQVIRLTFNCCLVLTPSHTLQLIRLTFNCYLLLTGAGVFLRPRDIPYVAHNSHYLVLTGAGVFLRPRDIPYFARPERSEAVIIGTKWLLWLIPPLRNAPPKATVGNWQHIEKIYTDFNRSYGTCGSSPVWLDILLDYRHS